MRPSVSRMRWLARLFVVLFCIAFIARQATSQGLSHYSELAEMMKFAAYGIQMSVELNKHTLDRVLDIEDYLKKRTGYVPVERNVDRINKATEQFKEATERIVEIITKDVP